MPISNLIAFSKAGPFDHRKKISSKGGLASLGFFDVHFSLDDRIYKLSAKRPFDHRKKNFR
ncbi:hypothetical protein CPZ30_18595 [Paenibacillus lautus]|nr:hypothetical protein CPZ30_18595 [Paenibacillus lautus]